MELIDLITAAGAVAVVIAALISPLPWPMEGQDRDDDTGSGS